MKNNISEEKKENERISKNYREKRRLNKNL